MIKVKKELRKQLGKGKGNKKRADLKWVLQLTVLAFMISIVFSFVTEIALRNANLLASSIAVLICIGIAVIFDIVAIAITSADEAPFHSMNAKKDRVAKIAIKLKKNAGKFSSIFSDVVGDICGIISGAAGVYIAVSLSEILDASLLVCTLLTTSVIASLTICAKALEKNFALEKNNYILYYTAKVISVFYRPK